jgi:hypothetical protein
MHATPSTSAITGTDGTPTIQAALDYAMQNHFEAVCISDGNYKRTHMLAYYRTLERILRPHCFLILFLDFNLRQLPGP